MDELAKKIQQRYIDDITSKYPLHRFICLYIYLFAFFTFYTKKDNRFIDSICEIKISFLFDFSNGLLSKATVSHLLISIIATYITVRMNNIIKIKIYNILCSYRNFENYINKIKDRVSKKAEDYSSITYDVSKHLEIKKAMLRGKQAISEITLTLLGCMITGIVDMIFLDWIFLIGGISIILFSQWESFRIYISEFIPYYVAEQVLLGKDVSFLNSKHEPHI